jgi:endoglucanase
MKLLSVLLLIPNLVYGASLTNHISGVGPQGAVKPWICIQNQSGQVTLALAPDQRAENANQASGSSYYVGASLRFNGCSLSDSYVGYVGFSLSNTGSHNEVTTYSPPDGVHISYQNRSLNSNGVAGGSIEYTPIETNPEFKPAPKTLQNWQFAGVNLSGLEFGKVITPVVIPNLSVQDSKSNNSDLEDTQAFINAGMNTIRLPISWGYLQLDGPGKGEINASYYHNYIKPLLTTLTRAKVYAIVDLHAYMRYSKFGEEYAGCGSSGKCPDGTLILDEQAYESVWKKLVTLIQNDPSIDKEYIMLDLVNEPVDVPGDKVFTIQASLIKMLRQNHYEGIILVEGNHWSGLHSWDRTWSDSNNNQYSNATLFSREHFAQAGITDLSKIMINAHQYLDSDYSGTHDDCLQDLTTQGDQGFNLDAFANYLKENRMKAMVTEFGTGRNASSCTAPLQQFMSYLQNNSAQGKDYGFAGWTLWSTGHGWGNYNLRVTPDSYTMSVIKPFI